MNKKYFSLFALILVLLNMNASQRSVSDAMEVAINHLKVNNDCNGRQNAPIATNLQLVYSVQQKDIADDSSLLYIFNVADNGGFIIVSGNDLATDILGYSHTGKFDASKIPDGLNFWLNGFADEIKSLGDKDILIVPESKADESHFKAQVSSQFSPAVNPLLGDIKWDQYDPYNKLCPIIPDSEDRAVTGCVATGMAQVMKYHQWPVQGIGSNTYTTSTHKIPLSVDFSATTYDWENMTNTYNSTSTDNEKLAVSTLMYHCGVAANMDYALASGASTLNMAKALINHFGYDSNLNLVQRDFYTRTEWTDLIKTELNALRPVLYSGNSTISGGHLFICDGYDSNDYFHFNWGWGGIANGYYAISALNTASQGVEGFSEGFNSYQDIVVGLQQPNASSSPIYEIYMKGNLVSSKQTIQRNEKTTITITETYNFGINDFSGKLGFGLYNNNNLIEIIESMTVDIKPYYGFTSEEIDNISIPATISNGTYKLHLIYKPDEETNWSIVRGHVGKPNYLLVEISDSQVTFSLDGDYKPDLTLNSLSTTGNVYQNKTGRFVVNLTNSGEEYNSVLGIHLQSTSESSNYQLITENANIATNETVSYFINKTITLEPGEYYLTALYDSINVRESVSSFSILGNTQIINILETPTDTAILALTSQISFPDNSHVNNEYDVLSAEIINTGGYYDNNMLAFIFPITGGSSLAYLGHQQVFLDTNEQKILSFAGNINLEPDQYQIITYYYNDSKWVRLLPVENSKTVFTIQSEFTTIDFIPEEIEQLLIYPSPANHFIHFTCNEMVDELSVYSMKGQLIKKYHPNKKGTIHIDISSLDKGNYLIKINTLEKIQIGRFIKL